MMVRFVDRQDSSNPDNERSVSDSRALLDVLDRQTARTPFFCELIGANGYTLLIGIANEVGCAQYSRTDGNPPYFMAVGKNSEGEQYVEFLIGDTGTPVDERYCLPFSVIKSIACHFTDTGEKLESVRWEEI